MFNIKTNYTNVERMDFSPLPEGNYECVIESTKEDATPSGKEKFQLKLVVRNDLDNALPETNGKYKNRVLFHDMWKRELPQGYVYDMEHFMYILEAVGIPEGTEINGIQQLQALLEGKPVRVFTKVEYNDYQGEDENTVAPWGYDKSNFQTVQHAWAGGSAPKPMPSEGNPFAGVSEEVNIDESDMPF